MGDVRPSYVEVDLAAIRHNVAQLAAFVAPAEMCAVVKADAYGHGDVPVAEAAVAGGATRLAVALVEEGIRLREGGIDVPILLLSEPPPEALARVVRWGLTPTVYSEDFAEALAIMGVSGQVPVHVKVDTGMHRVGAPADRALAIVRRLSGVPHLVVEGLWTHFAVADEDEAFTRVQADRFEALLSELGDLRPPVLHASNTAGAFAGYGYDMVRVGLGIYGLYPEPDGPKPVELRPALRIVSEVSYVQHLQAGERPSYGRRRPLPDDAVVATVPIGYADGVPRRLSAAGASVLIRGRRRPLAGTVTMDQIVVDGNGDSLEVGDEVVLVGRQGPEEITADEWARLLDTISYEIVCQIGPRLPRRYLS